MVVRLRSILFIISKVALCAISLVILSAAVYVVLIFDWRAAIATLPFFAALILIFIAWFIPREFCRKIFIAAGCVACSAIIAVISVTGVIVYELSVTIGDKYSGSSYAKNYIPFTDIAEKQSAISFENDAPHILASSLYYPLVANIIAATYPKTSFSTNGESYYLAVNRNPSLLYDGTFDIMIERDCRENEIYNPDPENTQWTTIARDALVIFTHKDNPVKSLTTQQLADICTGKITNWTEVGGEDMKIELYTSHNLTCPNDLLESYIGAKLSGYKTMRRMAFPYFAFPEYPIAYRNTRGAIGFNFFSETDERYKNTHAIAIDGVYASESTISSGEYPITEDICAVTYLERHEPAERLINWIRSEEGEEIIRLCGLCPA